jgi:site-specific DNA-methyltransferase (adenine-specific)/modification methylase
MNNLELNKIYCESNLETMARMPDNFIDLVVTSPPYNTGGKSFKIGNFYKEYKDNLKNSEYKEFIFNNVKELLRITKYYVVYNFQILSNNKMIYLEFLNEFKDNIKDIAIWKKQAVSQVKKGKMATGYEFIVILGKDSKMYFEYNNFPSNNYVPNIQTWHKKESIKGHGATMPVEMAIYFIEYFSKENDLIYDPFMGTGTTAIASVMQKRKFIGSEITQEYVDLANKRLEPYFNQKTIF